jgi:hypothetical protein
MKHFYILIVAGGMLLQNRTAFTQQPQALAPGAAAPTAANAAPAQRPEWQRMNIDFDGGPPDKLLAVMKKALGQMPNVMIHPDAENVTIPAFKLRDVSAAQVFIALNTLNEPPFTNGYWKAAPLPDGEIWTLTMPTSNVLQIDPTTGLPRGAQNPSNKNCKVLNLTQALSEYTVDDVTTAMKGAWDLLNSSTPPTVKFHKDTKLLIIVGDDRQINVANDVLRELMNNVAIKRRDAALQKEKGDAKQ